jgi:hypothetical protein
MRPKSTMSRQKTGFAPPVPRLHLSLASPGFAWLRVTQWVLSLVIIGSLGMAAWFWWSSSLLEREAIEHERAAARMQELNRQFGRQAAEAGFPVSEERMKALDREVAFANQLLRKRAFSWTRLLSDLEETVPPRVSLSAVTLSFTDATIALTGASSTLKDLANFVNTLERHAAFNNAVLSHHRFREAVSRGVAPAPRQADEAGHPRIVEFTLTVGYRPPR